MLEVQVLAGLFGVLVDGAGREGGQSPPGLGCVGGVELPGGLGVHVVRLGVCARLCLRYRGPVPPVVSRAGVGVVGVEPVPPAVVVTCGGLGRAGGLAPGRQVVHQAYPPVPFSGSGCVCFFARERTVRT